LVWLVGLLIMPWTRADRLGDLDGDALVTVRDLSRVLAHLQQTQLLPPELRPLADLDGDGAIAPADVDLFLAEILGVNEPRDLPLSTLRFTSPETGRRGVAVTRETIVHFTIPLAPDSLLDIGHFHAEFGGQRILSRVELAGDRAKATLFHLEPLPANARIQVTLDGTGLTDLLGRPFDADGDGQPGGQARFYFDTLSTTPVPGTAIAGRVLASKPGAGQNGEPVDVPLAGVTITVDGAEETLRAVTNGDGEFLLNPCPAGAFFVQVDGRTVPGSQYPHGRYYPTVGKEWYAYAGRLDNLAGPTGVLYLPEIVPGSLTPVSATESTPVVFPAAALAEYPELQGTLLQVPANALFADDGTRGGAVGIAPVSPLRLPEPLPPGLDLPLVITVQTDGGLNFDQPVPLRLPNLPDPQTGETLPPGAASALWSFNHDVGQWEVAGSMTVSEDGVFVTTDPGVGIRQPGWHGSRPGAQVSGEGPVLPPETAGEAESPDPASGDPDGEAPCPNEAANWFTTANLYTAIKEAGTCAAKLLPVSTAVKCAFTLATTTIDLLKTAQEFQDGLEHGLVSWQAAKAFIAHAKAVMARLLADDACIEDISPANRAKDIFDCLGNALTIGETICDAVDPQNVVLPPHCRPGILLSGGCATLREFKNAHASAAVLVNYLTSLEENFKLAALNGVLDALELLINNLAPPHPGQLGPGGLVLTGTPDRPLTAQEIADLLAATAEVTTEAAWFIEAGSEYPELANLTAAQQRAADATLQALSREISAGGRPPAGITYWAIDLGATTLRGRVHPRGTITALLAPNQDYVIKVFNPASGQYDEAPGYAAPNGRASRLSATILDPRAPPRADQDGDGVPDAAEFVLGTHPQQVDTDGDGLSDLAEALEGTDPTGGQPVAGQRPHRGLGGGRVRGAGPGAHRQRPRRGHRLRGGHRRQPGTFGGHSPARLRRGGRRHRHPGGGGLSERRGGRARPLRSDPHPSGAANPRFRPRLRHRRRRTHRLCRHHQRPGDRVGSLYRRGIGRSLPGGGTGA
jgi:hypothetical protein